MRTYPENASDKKDAERLNAQPWMFEMLKYNPSYVFWGPYEDYMCDKNAGWRSPSFINTVNDLWELDELNECVNFYFEVNRDSKECHKCEGSGYNSETKKIADDWYDFNGTGRRWCADVFEQCAGTLYDIS